MFTGSGNKYNEYLNLIIGGLINILVVQWNDMNGISLLGNHVSNHWTSIWKPEI